MRHISVLLGCFLALFANAQTPEERYRAFKQQAQHNYTGFREEANRQYADFLRAAWEYYETVPAIPKPREEQVPPVVYDEEQDRNRRNRQQDNGQERDRQGERDYSRQIPVQEDIVLLPEPSPQPQPVAPVIENNNEERALQITFYGTELSFRYSQEGFALSATEGGHLAAAWEQLSSSRYDNLLYDCLKVRNQLKLCDWAYLCLLQAVSEQACGMTDAAVFLQAFLYAQSGYQMPPKRLR